MADIFVNLKRFEVPARYGGLCPQEDPQEWIGSVIRDTASAGLADFEDVRLTYLLPESLIPAALKASREADPSASGPGIGCQGVHWDDIEPGGNFGAFTSLLPASAAHALGCSWAIIGHSEERRAKLQLLQAYDPEVQSDPQKQAVAARTVDQMVGAEVARAARRGLHVLVCVGETEAQRGSGSTEEQRGRVREVLRGQVAAALKGFSAPESTRIVMGYEPVWAIGPGKTPPGREYIGFVTDFIKQTAEEQFGFRPGVVYGGGLKEENAAMIAGVPDLDGGLIALTRFAPPIGFDVPGLSAIIAKYRSAAQDY